MVELLLFGCLGVVGVGGLEEELTQQYQPVMTYQPAETKQSTRPCQPTKPLYTKLKVIPIKEIKS